MSNSMVLLGTYKVNSTAPSAITFNNLPQTGYSSLRLIISGRMSGSSTPTAYLAINGSWSTNITFKTVEAYNYSSSGAVRGGTDTNMALGVSPSGAMTTGVYGIYDAFLNGYTSTTLHKTFGSEYGYVMNAGTEYAYLGYNSATYQNTSPVQSISIHATSRTWSENTTVSLYGMPLSTVEPRIVPKAKGGNIIATDGKYWYHAFTSSGTFVPSATLSCDVLTVAGGGSGGWPYSGGGGAGGVVYSANQSLPVFSYPVTVGAGGAGAYNTGNGQQGSNSQFNVLTAAVGGGGGGGTSAGGSGGSGGGGASFNYGTRTGGSATSGQGNAGGTGAASGTDSGGGGGGAGAVGGNATSSVGGAGGAGTMAYASWLLATGLGVSSYIAGGGGGGSAIGANPGAGGAGGGGRGADNDGSYESEAGTANTGGGSGGGAAGNAPASPKNGGSGVVIVRYAV